MLAAICLLADQLIIKFSFTFSFPATASSFLLSLVFDDAFDFLEFFSSFLVHSSIIIFLVLVFISFVSCFTIEWRIYV